MRDLRAGISIVSLLIAVDIVLPFVPRVEAWRGAIIGILVIGRLRMRVTLLAILIVRHCLPAVALSSGGECDERTGAIVKVGDESANALEQAEVNLSTWSASVARVGEDEVGS